MNPPGKGELDVFSSYGIATIEEMSEVVALSEAQYESIWKDLNIPGNLRFNSSEEKFAHLWKILPLQDALIAQLLGATRQQVINLRKAACDRLRRRLGDQIQMD